MLDRFSQNTTTSRPNVGERATLHGWLDGILDRNWLTNDGPFVQELERKLQNWLGVEHCIAVANGTLGLEIAAKALGLTGEVIVPAFTFVATAGALDWIGLKPVFADVVAGGYHIDPLDVERCITPQTSAICGVHLWGRACDTEALREIADKYGLALYYDAAHAFMCSHDGRTIGNFGDLEVFSFHATKIFNTFEGGAITTNDDELAERCRLMRNFGFQGPDDDVVSAGTNAKMSEIHAAMGLVNLEHYVHFVTACCQNYYAYERGLDEIPGVRLMRYDEGDANNYQYIVVRVDEDEAGVSRDDVIAALADEGILARRYFWPGCHRLAYYQPPDRHLPNTERLTNETMSLPNGTVIRPQDVKRICDVIRRTVCR
jgi:dTDP-4-amino-4,6-dideoxygalactose transaminase